MSFVSPDQFCEALEAGSDGHDFYLLVFVARRQLVWPFGAGLRSLLKEFSQRVADSGMSVGIVFPITPNTGSERWRELWDRYNPERIVPLFAICSTDGTDPALRFEGRPRIDDLMTLAEAMR